MKENRLLLKKAEAAASLGISMRQLEVHIARGELQTRKLGARCVRIEVTELERFVGSLAQASDTAR